MTNKQANHVNQVIIFDFDGLIIETEAIYCHIWQREFSKVGLAFDMVGYQNLIGAHHVVGGYQPHQELADYLNNGISAQELRLAVEREEIGRAHV